jgi:hypothetical protein
MNQFERILKFIRQRKADLSQVIASGGAKNMEHYRHMVGNIEAFSVIEDEIKKVLSEVEEQ